MSTEQKVISLAILGSVLCVAVAWFFREAIASNGDDLDEDFDSIKRRER